MIDPHNIYKKIKICVYSKKASINQETLNQLYDPELPDFAE
jgi:hypothetical protein